MPASFLHGVETFEYLIGPRKVREVRSAVIGLTGSAPMQQVATADQSINRPIIIRSDRDAARYFGAAAPGFTIPQAISAIFAQGYGTIVVVNTLNPATHKVAVVSESLAVTEALGKKKLLHGQIITATVKNVAGDVIYVSGTDYTLDKITGELTIISGGAIAYVAGTVTVHVTYDYADPSLVLAADIIGSVVGTTRTGMKALEDCRTLFGFDAKILIAPGFSSQGTVAAALDALSLKVKGIAIVDVPLGTPLQTAIEGRGPAGGVNLQLATDRVYVTYPYVNAFDPGTSAAQFQPLSQFAAGALARRDREKGYWWSPSNLDLKGVIGLELPLTARISDPNSDVNLLNEAGIATVFNDYGTGFKLWGNRMANFPMLSGPSTFISTRRTADVIEESIEQASMEFMDAPLTGGVVDTILETVNGFMRYLRARGAIVNGEAFFDPTKNPNQELADGHLTIGYRFLPPSPLERLTYEAFIDINLASGIRPSTQTTSF